MAYDDQSTWKVERLDDAAQEPSFVEVVNASKTYDKASQPALDTVSLAIQEQEFFTLLGPSGCGKTTLLRTIAGFEPLSSGSIRLAGEPIDHLAPNQRPVNTVFQNYALFPHMTVRENVSYGVLRKGGTAPEAAAMADRMLCLVQLDHLADRRPSQLSGGQQQRVALARALAPKPRVLLLDEPLSALDLKLRQAMRGELKALQEETGITFIFVTHDQEEALAMSDRIAVINAGQVQQLGTPEDIYNSPDNRFVATFIGETNMLKGKVMSVDADCHLRVALDLGIDTNLRSKGRHASGETVTMSIRPEAITVTKAQGDAPVGIVRRHEFLGTDTLTHIKFGEQMIVARRSGQQQGTPDEILSVGDKCAIGILPGTASLVTD